MPSKIASQRLVSPQAIIAMASIVALLGSLCLLAVSHSGALTSMLVVVDGLAAAAIILFRQLRKTTQSLIASEARAQHLSLHDGLTALPNRIRFLERLTQEVEQSRRTGGLVAVISVGIDEANQIKDAFGYQCGDELIQEVARRLSVLPNPGLMLARVSADEFAIIETDADRVDQTVAHIREVIPKPYALTAGRALMTCSVGVAAVFDETVDADDLLRRADIALRHARDTGRNGAAFYEPAMDRALQTRKKVEGELRAALAAGELTMVYQPQTNVHGGIVGVEALVRWAHRERGPIPPLYFVGLAEDAGLIHTLGEFTIRQAFIDARRWPHLKVAVNVSASQLARADFVGQVTRLIAETGADPSRFEIEITEGVLLGTDGLTQQNLQGLRALGFTLALDDFGVGYSSLGYLLQYNVDRIKIDRSFVSPLGGDSSVETVISAMIQLGDALNLRVLAEGVETEAQRRRLTDLGCKEFQGFLLSAPLPAEAIDGLLAAKVLLAA